MPPWTCAPLVSPLGAEGGGGISIRLLLPTNQYVDRASLLLCPLKRRPPRGIQVDRLHLPNANALTLQLGNLIKRINGPIRCLWNHLLQVRAILPGTQRSGLGKRGAGRPAVLPSPLSRARPFRSTPGMLGRGGEGTRRALFLCCCPFNHLAVQLSINH